MKKIDHLKHFALQVDPMEALSKINEVVDTVNEITNNLHYHDPDNVSRMVGAYKESDACPACADKPPNSLAGMPGVTFKDVTPHSEDCPNKPNTSSKTIEQVKEWVIQHHSHHVGCNKKGSAGCQDKDSPYVNSLALVDFLKELSG